jgi:hypothetical protein
MDCRRRGNAQDAGPAQRAARGWRRTSGYVRVDARTLLAGFFSILLNRRMECTI